MALIRQARSPRPQAPSVPPLNIHVNVINFIHGFPARQVRERVRGDFNRLLNFSQAQAALIFSVGSSSELDMPQSDTSADGCPEDTWKIADPVASLSASGMTRARDTPNRSRFARSLSTLDGSGSTAKIRAFGNSRE